MDAFAVAVASGFVVKRPKLRDAFMMALFFGGFQALMPSLGWAAGTALKNLISSCDHWIAFGLLLLIGIKMIAESFETEKEPTHPFDFPVLFALAVATSIDALAAGVSFALLKIAVGFAVVIIGTVTFLFSFLGVFIGKRFGHFLEHKVKIVGGAILILIGTKILVEHLTHPAG